MGLVAGREKQTSDTRTAAPSITHGSSLHASKIDHRRVPDRALQLHEHPRAQAEPVSVSFNTNLVGTLTLGEMTDGTDDVNRIV